MHRQVIEARESSFFYCELQVRSALLLAESKGADVTAALAYHVLQPVPTRPLGVWLGKVGKVLQYLDKPAPNQRPTNPVGNAIGWLRVNLRGDQLTWHFQPSAQKCTVNATEI